MDYKDGSSATFSAVQHALFIEFELSTQSHRKPFDFVALINLWLLCTWCITSFDMSYVSCQTKRKAFKYLRLGVSGERGSTLLLQRNQEAKVGRKYRRHFLAKPFAGLFH